MSIDPITLPDGTVVEIERCVFAIREDGQISSGFVGGAPFMPTRPITRVFVPVPDGMTYADAVTALADAGAWVEVEDHRQLPEGARVREERQWAFGMQNASRWVHRDDLPPADPDAELVEKMARAAALEAASALPWEDRSEANRDEWRDMARAALAALREHEAKS